MNICLWQVVSRLFILYPCYAFFFPDSSYHIVGFFFFFRMDLRRRVCERSSAPAGGSWNQKSLGYGGEELFGGIVQPLLPGLYPLEKCGLLDLAA